MTSVFTIEIIALILINIFSIMIMMYDKIRSRKLGARRISEGKLFFMATIFGSFGVYLGMFLFRHKVKRWYFFIGIPIVMLQNISFVYLYYLLKMDNFETIFSFLK